MEIIQFPGVRLSDLEDLLPEGTYDVRVHDAKFVPIPKKTDAHPYIAASLIVTGPDDCSLGRRIFANYPIAGGGRYRLRELLLATDHDADFELSSPDQLVGLELRVLVGVEKGNGVYADKNVVKRHLHRLA